MGFKRDANEIRDFVKWLKRKYNFVGVLHFTDFSNLKPIINNEFLYSRNYCHKQHIDFKDGSNHSVLDRASDFVHNCVRFYYRGKTPTLYNNEGIKLAEYCDVMHIPIPVYLLFDEELIYLDNTYFTNGNATTSERGSTFLFFKAMDWDTIFHCKWFDQEGRDYIVNKRQAELLCSSPVPLKYLKKIVFRCEADKKRAINIFGNDSRYTVDINLFSDKNVSMASHRCFENNFINDYFINIIRDSKNNLSLVSLKLFYQKPFTDYKTSFKILDKSGELIEFKNISKKVINEEENIKKIFLSGNMSDWYKLEIYVNDNLCFEEYLIKYVILKSDIRIENNKIVVCRKFSDLNYLKYDHRIEIVNNNNQVIENIPINYPHNSIALSWRNTLKKYNKEWCKIKYLMNNIVCFDHEFISK